MIRSAAAFAWIAGIVYNNALVFPTSAVIDGACYAYVVWKSETEALIHGIWNFVSFFIIVISVFVFCYGNILVVIRRQARVMAGHSGPGSSTSRQTQSSQIQSSVAKTMTFVGAFYVITWTPSYTFYLLSLVKPDLAVIGAIYYVGVFLGFMYICANPFIYAVKFHPVRRVLVGLIPRKKSQQAAENVEMTPSGTAAVRLAASQR